VKGRLNRIGAALDFVDVTPEEDGPAPARETPAEILERLARGEITAEEAAAAISRSRGGSE
jgi:hypothetical protein